MISTFQIVADIVSRTCQVPREAIAPDSHLLRDLGLDSLDLFDVGFALDDAFGIRMPLGQWVHAMHIDMASADRCFIIQELCANIDTMRGAATL